MTRPDALSAYDDDFYAWTQAQAAALRDIPKQAAGVEVDIEHVAEEIEDLGKRDLREVRSFLTRLVEHLIKIAVCPGSIDIPHWRSEIQNFHYSAADAYSPSMRHLIDMRRVWSSGIKLVDVFLEGQGTNDRGTDGKAIRLPDNAKCPFVIDDLISDDFHIDAALATIIEMINA